MSYQADFIKDFDVALPRMNQRLIGAAFDAGEPIDHSRFSLVFHEERGFAIFTAHNVDGESMLAAGTIPRDDNFRPDPAIQPDELQVNNERGYKGVDNPWDRGHMVRRSSLHWGNVNDARVADDESFFWSNIAPQHRRLHSSAWGHIERWMLGRVAEDNRRACVFTGPIFTLDDPTINNGLGEPPFRLPAGFWKVMATRDGSRRVAAGFIVWQRDFDSDTPVTFDPALEQVRISTIEHLTGLAFPNLQSADPLLFTRTGRSLIPGIFPPTPVPQGSARIARPEDLIL
jgi:endonuclease G